MDVFDAEKRSFVMSKIKSTGTKSTEAMMSSIMAKEGLTDWDEHDPSLPGKPDFVFKKQRVAVFIDGCFWHGCPHCYDGHIPKSNTAYWTQKIERNQKRDRRVASLLRQEGWSVIRIWECRLKKDPDFEFNRILRKLKERAQLTQ